MYCLKIKIAWLIRNFSYLSLSAFYFFMLHIQSYTKMQSYTIKNQKNNRGKKSVCWNK